jgi:hypothetical protein
MLTDFTREICLKRLKEQFQKAGSSEYARKQRLVRIQPELENWGVAY